jgi:hypothetical protein
MKLQVGENALNHIEIIPEVPKSTTA